MGRLSAILNLWNGVLKILENLFRLPPQGCELKLELEKTRLFYQTQKNNFYELEYNRPSSIKRNFIIKNLSERNIFC